MLEPLFKMIILFHFRHFRIKFGQICWKNTEMNMLRRPPPPMKIIGIPPPLSKLKLFDSTPFKLYKCLITPTSLHATQRM